LPRSKSLLTGFAVLCRFILMVRLSMDHACR
jgi:hypothetical protein